MAKTLKTVTLDCRVNQYETEYLRRGFERLGYRDAVDGEPVDLCVVNGCVVTAESEAKGACKNNVGVYRRSGCA